MAAQRGPARGDGECAPAARSGAQPGAVSGGVGPQRDPGQSGPVNVRLPCVEHGCIRYAIEGQSRCARHHAERWQNGLTSTRGWSWRWEKLRKQVYERQGGVCAGCGQFMAKDDFEVHHADGDAYNDEPGNLEALHPPCHRTRKIVRDRIGRQPSAPAPVTRSVPLRLT